MKIKVILVVIDPTRHDQPILGRAIRVAKACSAQLELFLAEHHASAGTGNKQHSGGFGKASEIFSENRKSWLESIAERVRASDVKATTFYSPAKSLYAAIVERSVQINADLIMKATHHHSVLKRALFTHTDWHLIRESAAHIWFVKEHHIWGSHAEIMAALDPMPEHQTDYEITRKILTLAHKLACYMPAELGVIHAYEPIPLGMLAGIDHSKQEYTDYRTQVKQEHEAALKTVLENFGETSIKICLNEGAADKVIEDIALQESIDLMVVGAVSHSRIDRILVGSTAERVLEKICCDVLVVK